MGFYSEEENEVDHCFVVGDVVVTPNGEIATVLHDAGGMRYLVEYDGEGFDIFYQDELILFDDAMKEEP